MGVKLIWYLKKLNVKLIETPIHFHDRKKGKSKLPKMQIFISAFDVFFLSLKICFLKKWFIVAILIYMIIIVEFVKIIISLG